MATLPQITNPPQSGAPEVANENFTATEHQTVYAKAYLTTSGLVWGYYGGRWGGFTVAAGTFTLTVSTTNYIVVEIATGATTCSATNTNWNNTTDYARVYKLTTSASAVTATEDHRAGPGGVQGGSGAAGAGDLLAANNLSDVANAATARTNLGVDAAIAAAVAGLSWKQAVRAATTANGTLATAFENGDTIDGVTLATGDRILVKNQSSGAENGIYVVAASGAPTRATDADSGAELVNASVYVSEGTTLADTQWTCTTNAAITVGSTSLAFAQLATGGGDALTTNPLSQFAATTSLELKGVISDETGSGALVFATSPTLVTPALGTPSALVLTNATGLPLTTGVTGVLPVANFTTGTPTGSKFVRDDGVLAVPAGSGDALTADPLSQFAATTSAQLRGVLSDETGTGAAVFADTPTLVTPVLGTPTSGNLSSCTADGTNAVGFRHIPQNSQSTAYTTVLADAGKHILHPSADTTARTMTIDSNANVAYAIGAALTFVNQNAAGVMTIAVTSDTMRLAGAGTTGSRTLAANGIATALKVTATEWIISGTGLT